MNCHTPFALVRDKAFGLQFHDGLGEWDPRALGRGLMCWYTKTNTNGKSNISSTAYADIGKRDEASKLLAQLDQVATRRYVGAYNYALVHVGLGEKEKAIDDLERAYRERSDPHIVNLKFDPMLDPLRGDPRFEALVQKVFSQKH